MNHAVDEVSLNKPNVVSISSSMFPDLLNL